MFKFIKISFLYLKVEDKNENYFDAEKYYSLLLYYNSEFKEKYNYIILKNYYSDNIPYLLFNINSKNFNLQNYIPLTLIF